MGIRALQDNIVISDNYPLTNLQRVMGGIAKSRMKGNEIIAIRANTNRKILKSQQQNLNEYESTKGSTKNNVFCN